MPVICIGPVCVPTNLLLPFVIGALHRMGYLNWFKTEWVTFRWWRKQLRLLAWSIVKSGIVKWWRGDKSKDEPERPPTLPEVDGPNMEAIQAERAARDAVDGQQPSSSQQRQGGSSVSSTGPAADRTPGPAGSSSAGSSSAAAQKPAAAPQSWLGSWWSGKGKQEEPLPQPSATGSQHKGAATAGTKKKR